MKTFRFDNSRRVAIADSPMSYLVLPMNVVSLSGACPSNQRCRAPAERHCTRTAVSGPGLLQRLVRRPGLATRSARRPRPLPLAIPVPELIDREIDLLPDNRAAWVQRYATSGKQTAG